ncbi:hypothetical protein M911_12795 [Ectothiorhodospira haloalkaliphila]|uniref:Uncharacterized protein n=1 Tax=Ectothiorhodospira haloalkaliphila TaxID=421628 RepID=W8KWD6_9GAMM|nr:MULTISPECIES: hypothetical protein [Ectothiorhodospira]AHK79886.1 hypothetical protein M911_12795 [Ectothiorhodospira haloalkaliphila]MCG5493316.1 hypothetical protein [Ectothiorhodospira variabilis]MCG5496660.1 hypothetical protein [Ectothiorhodospira variabilis]MCG5502645.1 hypothetical protein [Ectothiorhodospira variabilis]MCG5505589.1 hypothetical protein [Ectothiorhodospira variabilis]
MDPRAVEASFEFNPETVGRLRSRWLALMETSLWGDLKTSKIGTLPRLRKRWLELGENLVSLTRDRRWIPQPRERVKGAMAASLNLRDSLLHVERSLQVLDGGEDFAAFEKDILQFRQELLQFMEHHEKAWGDLLESQYDPPEE